MPPLSRQELQRAIEWRRALHRAPEPTWKEVETARRIRTELDRAGVPWRACAETGTVGMLAPEAPGRHVALRADIDALPIGEQTGVAWTSENPGCMHACGHDGHTATLMAAAWALKRQEAELPGPVTLLFQPAEEGGHGALRMIEDGALRGVDIVFGWHNWPAIRLGKAVCPDGIVMAANGTFRITIEGKGGHASQPEAARDPILAAAAVTMALQQIVARRLPPQQPAVVSVTSIDGASSDTIIPQQVIVGGSIRVADDGARAMIEEAIRSIAEQTAAGHGVRAHVEIFPRYGTTRNDPKAAEEMRGALGAVLGPDWRCTKTPLPIMASEDFSYYLQEVPGAFALIGADDGNGHDHPCHSPHYDFNDALIEKVVAVYLCLASGGPA